MRHYMWDRMSDAIDLVVGRYGGSIYDGEAGKSWDPGQAICREIYGVGWNTDPSFLESNQLPSDQFPEEALEPVKRVVEERGYLQWKEAQILHDGGSHGTSRSG